MGRDTTTELGTLPETWRVCRFDSVFAIQQGKQVSKNSQGQGELRPFLRTKNVVWGGIDLDELDEMTFTGTEQARLALLPGDLLICEGGDIGRTGIWRGEAEGCYYQNHLHRARPRTGAVDPQFVLYWLWYAFEIGRVYFGRGNVTTIPNLSKSRLGELPIAVPESLDEQKAIARVLRLVEDAIASREAIRARVRELKDAVVAHLLSQAVTEQGGDARSVGTLTATWPTVRMGDVCRLSTGTTPATGRPDYYVGDTPLIKTAEIANNRITTSDTYISDAAVVDYSLRKYPPGTVLMAMYGQGKTRGRVSLLEIGAATTQNAAAIECGDEVDPEYLWQYLMSRYQYLRGAGALGHISHLNLGYAGDLPLPLPPISDQRAIVAVLNSVDARSNMVGEGIARLRELFKALLVDLMTARMRTPSREAVR